jgi:hypothetical protein
MKFYYKIIILITFFCCSLITYSKDHGLVSSISKPTSYSVISKKKEFKEFLINGNKATINGQNISVVLPYGTDLTNLIAEFKTDGKLVKIKGVNQISGQTPNNFVNPVIYTIIDNDTIYNNYIVAVYLKWLN